MRTHLTILAVLHFAQGLVALFTAIAVIGGMALAGGAMAFVPDVPGWVAGLVGSLGAFIGLFLLALALPGIALGYALLARKSWARPLGLVVGALSLFNFPLGTAVGAYTIWALLQAETQAILRASSFEAV